MTKKIIVPDQWLALLESRGDVPANATAEAESLMVSMPGGFCVQKPFLDRVFAQAKHRLPTLEQGHVYTVRKMLGKAYWDRLTDLERRNAGRCIALLASIGLLPLELVGRRRDNAQEFRLN
jgi:hypothetical protein